MEERLPRRHRPAKAPLHLHHIHSICVSLTGDRRSFSAGPVLFGEGMSKSKIAGIIVVALALLGALMPPKNNLTDEQRLEITDKCIQNPDAWYCR